MEFNQFLTNFDRYLNQFYQKKSNQLSFSNSTVQNRIQKVTLDLSVERGLQIDGVINTGPYKVGIPFRSVHVEQYFQTSNPAIVKTGYCNLLFDYQNINNVFNAKLLQQNDSFVLDQVVATAFVTNNVQLDTSVTIAFMIDIDYKAGTTQSVISGGVEINGYPSLKNFNISPTIGLGYVEINLGTFPVASPFTLTANSARAGVWIKNFGGPASEALPGGYVTISTDTAGQDPINTSGNTILNVASVIDLGPGEAIYIPSRTVIHIAAPDTATIYGYTQGNAIIGFFEVET